MKKFFALFLALIMVMSLAACSGGGSTGGAPVAEATDPTEATSADFYAVTEPIEIVWWHSLEDQYTEILGVKIPMNTIPITPGRNLAVILEVAAMNNRQRKFGYNPALEFTEQINRHFDENMGQPV